MYEWIAQQQPPSLLLNALPVGFDRRVGMRVGRLPYEGHDAFVSLRERLSGTHVVRRRGNQVEIVALKAELVPLGTIDNIPAGDVIDLSGQLLTEWLIDHFTQLGRRVFQRRRALIIVSDKAQDDLLVQAVPRESSFHRGLAFAPPIVSKYGLIAQRALRNSWSLSTRSPTY